MKPPELSIVIPAYQEAERIAKSLEELAAYLKQNQMEEVEVIVAVATSPDGTAKLAQKKSGLFKNFQVVDAGTPGKGHNVQVGIMAASGAYKLFMDADLATPLHHIHDVEGAIRRGAEVIIAVRDLETSHTGLRKMVSELGNSAVRASLLPGIPDTQCGFKAFSARAAEELFGRQTIMGWGFDMEILFIARKLGFTIEQIKVEDWHDKPDGTFENGVIRAAASTLTELGRIRWQGWIGTYRRKRLKVNGN